MDEEIDFSHKVMLASKLFDNKIQLNKEEDSINDEVS